LASTRSNPDAFLAMDEEAIEDQNCSKRSSRSLCFHWMLWSLFVLFVGLGTLVRSISSTAEVSELVLRPEHSVILSVFRPMHDKLRLTLSFKGNSRPEHGDYGQKTGTGGLREFINPGEPIKLMVNTNGIETIYEAEPITSSGAFTFGRNLVPFIDDGNPRRISLVQSYERSPSLPVGRNMVKITVLEVGRTIAGETTSVIVLAPLGFKTVQSGYGFFWWFVWWPFYALLLLIHAAILIRLSVRRGCMSWFA